MSLSPSYGKKFVLLPQDRQAMEVLGLTEEEYREVASLLANAAYEITDRPTNFLLIPFLINLAIGVALSAVSVLLNRPRQQGKPVNTEVRETNGQTLVDGRRFAPKSGFDSVQNVVELGSIVPVIFTVREILDGKAYGGVRVNGNLVFSQTWSLGGSQMVRLVYAIGEAGLTEIDPFQFAFGNNLIGTYDINPTNNTTGRVTIYANLTGGRITSAHRIAGRTAATDPGNQQRFGAPDVFCSRVSSSTFIQASCYTFRPSSQTTFGVYAPMGVGLTYRINPIFEPVATVNYTPHTDGSQTIFCRDDTQRKAQRNKQDCNFDGRAHITGGDNNLNTANVNDIITYYLDSGSDDKAKFIVPNSDGEDGELGALDAASAIASRLHAYDEALTIGELYSIGTCICVLESRTEGSYASGIDFRPPDDKKGRSIVATFRVVEGGRYNSTQNQGSPSPGNYGRTGTRSSHIMKVAIASFALERSAQFFEVGFRTRLGININGICNFRDCIPYSEIDARSCESFDGVTISAGGTLQTQSYRNGTHSGPEERYTFHRIRFRIAGATNASWTSFSPLFGFNGVGQQDVFNYIKFAAPTPSRWEISIVPVPGWAVRKGATDPGIASGSLELVDYRNPEKTFTSQGWNITYRGKTLSRDENTFELIQGRPPSREGSDELGLPYLDDINYIDDWGKLAEQFCYGEVTASCESGPEHEIVYINMITPPSPECIPNYKGLALVGVNMQASSEFKTVDQFSVYVNKGNVNTHLFPYAFAEMLKNGDYGVGNVFSPQQLDNDSFVLSANWTASKKYFFDMAISEPVNLRTRGHEWAAFFLLDLIDRNGKLYLHPTVDLDAIENPRYIYSAGNIIDGTFEYSWLPVEDRTPPIVNVRWRRERPSGDALNRGLFPSIQMVTVREETTPANAPRITLDMSDFCTSEDHAIDIGMFTAQARRLVTHSVRFKTTPEEGYVGLGQIFHLAMETGRYNTPPNGYIGSDGTVSCWPAIPDGAYTMYTWNGTDGVVSKGVVSIIAGKAVGRTNTIFALEVPDRPLPAYKVDSISFDEDGNLEITATIWPFAGSRFGYRA